MRLEIAERLRPFSHLPGIPFILPGTCLSIAVFPTLLRIHDLSSATPLLLSELKWNLQGPVSNFTSILDLERGELRVFGTSQQGYFRYHLKSLKNSKGIALHIDKTPQPTLNFQCKGTWNTKQSTVQAGESIIIGEGLEKENSSTVFSLPELERLSLGSHKLQDWELVRRRLAMDEIFPIWHRLGQLVPHVSAGDLQGTALLLNQCQQRIMANAPEKILEAFHALFLAGFEGVLSPRLIDTDFQGISYHNQDIPLPAENSKTSPMILLKEGTALIRSLFIQEKPSTIYLLPALPPEFHCGRFLNVKCGKEGTLNLEWTKKSLRIMTFSASKDQQIAFHFSNHERKCRLRSGHRDRGVEYLPGTPLTITAGRNYWFDRFQR
jgi:hypothetical protein